MKLQEVALSVALGHVADEVREVGGENQGDQIRDYLRNAGISVPAPWCAAAIQWWSDAAAQILGIENPLDQVSREALVADYVTLARAAESADVRMVQPWEGIHRGDLVVYRFGSSGRWNHIGLVMDPPARVGGVLGGQVSQVSVEGNTTGPIGDTTEERQREGDGVFRRVRNGIQNRLEKDRIAWIRWGTEDVGASR